MFKCFAFAHTRTLYALTRKRKVRYNIVTPKGEQTMKKKLLFLPLVLVAPILASCGGVKAPKFANEGNNVDAATFASDFQATLEKFDYHKEDKVGSTVVKDNSKEETNDKIYNGKVNLSEYKIKKDSTIVWNGDTENLVASKVEKTTKSSVAKQDGISLKSNDKIRTDEQVQAATYDGKNYCVAVDNKNKLYAPLVELDETITMAFAIDSVIKDTISEYYNDILTILASYASSSEEDQAKYKFYENENIYTITFEEKIENKEYTNSDGDVYKVENSTDSSKWQIDLSNGKFAYKTYSEYSEKIEYKLNYGSHAAGEIEETVTKRSHDVNGEAKSINIKAANLEGYMPVEF